MLIEMQQNMKEETTNNAMEAWIETGNYHASQSVLWTVVLLLFFNTY